MSLPTSSFETSSSFFEQEVNADMLLDSAEQHIYEIRQNREDGGLVHIKKVITGETFEKLDKLTKEEYKEDYEEVR